MGRERTGVDLKRKEGGGKKSHRMERISHRTFFPLLHPYRCWRQLLTGARFRCNRVFHQNPTPLSYFSGKREGKDVERRFLSLTHAWTWLNELSARHLRMISNERPFLPKSIITSVRYTEEDMRFPGIFSHIDWRLYFIHPSQECSVSGNIDRK